MNCLDIALLQVVFQRIRDILIVKRLPHIKGLQWLTCRNIFYVLNAELGLWNGWWEHKYFLYLIFKEFKICIRIKKQ